MLTTSSCPVNSILTGFELVSLLSWIIFSKIVPKTIISICTIRRLHFFSFLSSRTMSRFLSRFCHITYYKVIHDVEFVLFTSPSIGELCESTISGFIFLTRLAWMLRQFEIRLHYHFSALLDQWWFVSISAFFQENMKNKSITVFFKGKNNCPYWIKTRNMKFFVPPIQVNVTGAMNVKIKYHLICSLDAILSWSIWRKRKSAAKVIH